MKVSPEPINGWRRWWRQQILPARYVRWAALTALGQDSLVPSGELCSWRFTRSRRVETAEPEHREGSHRPFILTRRRSGEGLRGYGTGFDTATVIIADPRDELDVSGVWNGRRFHLHGHLVSFPSCVLVDFEGSRGGRPHVTGTPPSRHEPVTRGWAGGGGSVCEEAVQGGLAFVVGGAADH